MELHEHSFLSIFDPDSAARLMGHCRLLPAKDGEVLFREGEPADALYLVLEGTVVLTAQAAGDHQEFIAEVGPDDFFGEFGVLDGDPRSARATARGSALLARVPGDPLLRELGGTGNNPAIRLMIHTIRKMRLSNRRHVEELIRREKMTLLGRMVLGIIHDFRNPFSIMLMSTELIRSGLAEAEAMDQCCAVIVEQIERVNAMAEEVLDYSRGQTSLRVEPVDLADLLRRFAALNEKYLESRGVRLEVRSEAPCALQADPNRLLRVLQNLVFNAADALGNGGGTIAVVQEAPAQSHAHILVRDDGPGIPEEIRARLFEPFQTKGKVKGLGLGLAIAKQFVDAHGGSLTVDSQPGQGATFRILLPLSPPP